MKFAKSTSKRDKRKVQEIPQNIFEGKICHKIALLNTATPIHFRTFYKSRKKNKRKIKPIKRHYWIIYKVYMSNYIEENGIELEHGIRDLLTEWSARF